MQVEKIIKSEIITKKRGMRLDIFLKKALLVKMDIIVKEIQ